MLVNFNRQFQIILTSIQLALYVGLGILAIYKILIAKKHNAKFLCLFYLFVLLDTIAYSSMMVYQIVKFGLNQDIYMIILVMINVFSMIIEAVIISLLSFYWKETEVMLRGSGLETLKSISGIKNELKIKGSLIGFWFLIYSAFLIYTIASDNQINNQVFKDIFYFGGQGFTTFLLIWANFSQAMNAKQFSFTLKRYQTLVSYEMNKKKFRCIYWVATSVSFIRLAYLIVAAVFFRIKKQSEEVEWLGMLIYTASGLIPLAIYLYSFQVNSENPRPSLSTFIDVGTKTQRQSQSGYKPPIVTSPYQKKKQRALRESFNETELSSSYDSHGI